MPDSLYRTRSANVRRNFDLRHPQELWRFQTGQAVQLRPAGSSSTERLLALATRWVQLPMFSKLVVCVCVCVCVCACA